MVRVPEAGVVHQRDDDLVLDVGALVIVPVVLRRNDPIAHEHKVACGMRLTESLRIDQST